MTTNRERSVFVACGLSCVLSVIAICVSTGASDKIVQVMGPRATGPDRYAELDQKIRNNEREALNARVAEQHRQENIRYFNGGR